MVKFPHLRHLAQFHNGKDNDQTTPEWLGDPLIPILSPHAASHIYHVSLK